MPVKKDVIPVPCTAYLDSARVLGSAFINEPVTLAIYKNLQTPKRLHNLIVDFSAEMEVCTRYGCPVQVMSEEKVVAAAIIYPPGSYPLPWIEQIRILIRSIIGHYYYDICPYIRWISEIEKVDPPEPHYYLEYLGVLPEYQGLGFGSAILQYLAERAGRENAACFLETASDQNLPLYERFSFRVIAEKQILGLKTWFMWRQP